MQSPPTSPRRRGRLPPKAPWLRPRHRRAEEFIAARMGPAGPLPGRRWNVSAAIRTSPAAVRQLLFLDREDRAFLHLEVAHDANAAGLIAELDVVASGLAAGDSQALVVVDRSVPIILALVGTPAVFPRRRHLERRDRVQGEIPESNTLAVLRRRGRSHESECDRSEQHTAHSRLPQRMHWLRSRHRGRPHWRSRRSIFCALSKFLAASSPIGSISLVEARSAPLKSAPLSVTRASVAPPKAAPRSEALVRSAFWSDANSRSTRDRSASRRIARSRLLDFSTARISPMD